MDANLGSPSGVCGCAAAHDAARPGRHTQILGKTKKQSAGCQGDWLTPKRPTSCASELGHYMLARLPGKRRVGVLKKGVAGCVLALAYCMSIAGSAFGAGLADGRGYEMVSPPDKAGGSVGLTVERTRAAADGSAIAFISLTPFGDAVGTGIETEYIAQRTGQSGTPGWATHAITPRQDPLSIFALTNGGSPAYVDEFSPDLSTGIFRAWSPLTDAPDVANVENLYVRRGLRSAGGGASTLVTACPACAGTPLTSAADYPSAAGASADFRHVIFESTLNLTGDGGGAIKLYRSDDGAVSLVGLVPPGAATSCGGAGPPCVLPPGDGSSIAGLGAAAQHTLVNVISADGSRVNFTAPTAGGIVDLSASNIYQRDTHGTAATADDTTVLLNASESTAPGGGSAGAVYQGASTDGSRIFFTSDQAMTDDTPLGFAHLYMWHETPNDEVQRLTVSASGGTFTLSFDGQTTAPLSASASAAQVAAALDALSSIGGAGGSVDVTGGPGDDAGSTPYLLTFGDALGGRDLPLVTADGTSLTGSAPGASVAPWVAGGGHLTVIDRDEDSADAPGRAEGVIGTSKDGAYVYFVANSQLVPGKPLLDSDRRGIYLWHDGELRFVGALTFGAVSDWVRNMPVGDRTGQFWGDIPSRVTPDGRTLLFSATNGSGLTGYDHTGCGAGGAVGCTELYVYHADDASLACVSCNPNGPPSSDANSFVSIVLGVLGSAHQPHALSDDGRWVFFTTGDALVPGDVNARRDVYEYDSLTGRVSLVSSGKSTSDSYFMDASASGKDAFFATREPLVGWDVDDSYDLYDARVGGGVPGPVPPSPCSGSACQGPLNGAPAVVSGGSVGFVGSGNVHERVRAPPRRKKCARGKVRRRVRGKARCVKRRKARHRHRRTASHTVAARGVR
ncbi:MAG: hypothetical protein JSS99_07335 [Actinobacteria bacterium]|nr:hypothetical protein [Actinomycetota bacterium]